MVSAGWKMFENTAGRRLSTKRRRATGFSNGIEHAGNALHPYIFPFDPTPFGIRVLAVRLHHICNKVRPINFARFSFYDSMAYDETTELNFRDM
jgi:hypothetical protein